MKMTGTFDSADAIDSIISFYYIILCYYQITESDILFVISRGVKILE